jgi:hypothetical protein
LEDAARRPVAERAVLALALASVPDRAGDTLTLTLGASRAAVEFADRWRLVQAAAGAAPSAELDAWLAEQARDAQEWMLRAAALEALARRASPSRDVAARAALTDAYPRVRGAALAALASAPDAVDVFAKALREDTWFLVRAQAIDALAPAAGSEALVTSALSDKASSVRASAMRALRRLHLVNAWPAAAKRVSQRDEFPDVIAEGIRFAKAACIQQAAPTLQGVVTRGLQPEAWAPDQELALSALEALVALGGEPARWAADESRSPLVPEPVRTAIQQRVASNAACQPEP